MANNSYDGNQLSDLDPSKPFDTESLGTAAAALRQIKRVMRNDGEGGLTAYIETLVNEQVNTLRDMLVPVGGTLQWFNDINPATIFEGTTWEKVEGLMPIGTGIGRFESSDSTYLGGVSAGANWHGSTSYQVRITNDANIAYIDFWGNDDAGWYSYSECWMSIPLPTQLTGTAEVSLIFTNDVFQCSNQTSMIINCVLSEEAAYNPSGRTIFSNKVVQPNGNFTENFEITASDVNSYNYIILSMVPPTGSVWTNSVGYGTIIGNYISANLQGGGTVAVNIPVGASGLKVVPYIGVNFWRRLT